MSKPDEDTEQQPYDVLAAATTAYVNDLRRKGQLGKALNRLTPDQRAAIGRAEGYQEGRRRGW